MLEFMNLKGKKGITILALAITIIILLILAGISISALTGDNGLIANAGNAKEQAEIDNEKEVLNIATTQAMGKDKYGDVRQTELQTALDSNAGNGKTEVIDNEDTLVVKFVDSRRYYEVDSNGNTSNPVEAIEDEYAGDLTKGGRCNGTEEKPYEINCIEDLVTFSRDVNTGNNYSGKYIKLMRTLDFNSIFSYNNYDTTIYDVYLGGDGNIGLKEELTKGKGFKSIGNANNSFKGIFIGNNKAIQNMYIYNETAAYQGFFGRINNAMIMDLKLNGQIDSISYIGRAFGGIAGYGCGTLINCDVSVEILNAPTVAGGIIGTVIGDTEIISCSSSSPLIINANNWFGAGGGIIGCIEQSAENKNIKVNIFNCSNIGNITVNTNMSTSIAGGIIGRIAQENNIVTIQNCYNIGELKGANYIVYKGGIIGYGLESINIENCYYLNNATNAVGNISKDGAIAITELQVQGQDDELNLTEKLNLYIDDNEMNWRKWREENTKYPIFVDES